MALLRSRVSEQARRDRALAYYSRLQYWTDYGCVTLPESRRPFAQKLSALQAGKAVIIEGRALGMQYDHSATYRLEQNNSLTRISG